MEKPVVFAHLRALHLGALSSSPSLILIQCAEIPRLESLSLAFRDSVGAGAPSAHGSGLAAPIPEEHKRDGAAPLTLSALRTLRASGGAWQIEQVLAAISSPLLHTASLAVIVPDGDADGWTRVSALLTARFAASLHTLRAEVTRLSARASGQSYALAQAVQQLLPLRELRRCTLLVRDSAGVAMDGADVAAIAGSWRALEALDISFPRDARGARPLIASLVALARGCPGLTTLRIPVSADVSSLPPCVPDTRDALESRDAATPGRRLWLDGVCFTREESQRVVSFLKRWFPVPDLRSMVDAGIVYVY